jgi:hypothetical protein
MNVCGREKKDIYIMSSDRDQAGMSEQYSRQPDFNIRILYNYYFF